MSNLEIYYIKIVRPFQSFPQSIIFVLIIMRPNAYLVALVFVLFSVSMAMPLDQGITCSSVYCQIC
jgi:hypothetical protein